MPKSVNTPLHSKRVWGVILVNLATMAWASNAVLGRWLRADVGPLTLTTLRFTAATAFFSLLLRSRPPVERHYGKDKWWILAMGLAGVVCFSPLLYLGRLARFSAPTPIQPWGFDPCRSGHGLGVLLRLRPAGHAKSLAGGGNSPVEFHRSSPPGCGKRFGASAHPSELDARDNRSYRAHLCCPHDLRILVMEPSRHGPWSRGSNGLL
jgi:hypothetical protein